VLAPQASIADHRRRKPLEEDANISFVAASCAEPAARGVSPRGGLENVFRLILPIRLICATEGLLCLDLQRPHSSTA